MARDDTGKIHLSSAFDYYQRMMNQANTQFAEAAVQI